MIRNFKNNGFVINQTKVMHGMIQLSLICFGVISLYYSAAGTRIYLYEIVGSLTIFGLICYFFSVRKFNRSNFSQIKIVVLFLVLFFLIDMISSIGVILGGNDQALVQHLKGIFKSLFLTVFLIVFLLFNAITNFRYSIKYFNILWLMVLLSCLYQFLYLVFFLMYEVNIDDIVWPVLSFGGYMPEENSLLGNDTFSFARHGGFSKNANMLVTQILGVLPYILLMSLLVSKRYILVALIFVISIFLTISRSGILGLAVIICCIPFINKRILINYGFFMLTWTTGIGICFVIIDSFFNLGFLTGIYDLFIARSADRSYFESPRWSLVLAGLDMFNQSPVFGNGINSSPILLESYSITALTGPDLHNYWVQLFVERGIFSILKVLFYGFILFQCYKFNNIFSQALIISLVSLLINSLTNNGLAHPFIQLSIVCIYCCCIYRNSFEARTYNIY